MIKKLLICVMLLSLVFAKQNANLNPNELKKPPLSLEESLVKARENYPLHQNQKLIDEALELSLTKLNKNFIPHLKLGGKASYQSDVTSLPFTLPPALNIDYQKMKKDQYNAYVELSQPLLDFATLAQKSYATAQHKSSRAQLENELYKVQQAVINAYFALLLLNLQEKQNTLHLNELKKNEFYVQNKIKNGVGAKDDLERIEIEILKAQTTKQELYHQKLATYYTLSKLTNLQTNDYELILPDVAETTLYLSSIGNLQDKLLDKRPEMAYFDAKKSEIESFKELENAKSLPYVEAYAQAGYGRPGLNMLKSEFDSYYLAGIRFGWDFSNLYSHKEQSELRRVQKMQISAKQDEFILNTKILLVKAGAQALSLLEKYKQSEKIAALQAKITQISQSKMQNGTLSVNDFLTDINKLQSTRLESNYLKVQFLMQVFNIKQILNLWEIK